MNVKIENIELNNGQLKNVPKNPRFIRDARFNSLINSIKDNPEFLSLRELILVNHPTKENKYVCICGNMRLRVAKDLGYKEIPAKILPKETTDKQIRAYIIKDNVSFGTDDMDLLANEWDYDELELFGVELQYSESKLNQIEEEEKKILKSDICEHCGQKIKK